MFPQGSQILVDDFTGCPKKNFALFWGAIAPINFELEINPFTPGSP